MLAKAFLRTGFKPITTILGGIPRSLPDLPHHLTNYNSLEGLVANGWSTTD